MVVTVLMAEVDARTVAAFLFPGQWALLQAPITDGDPADATPQNDAAGGKG